MSAPAPAATSGTGALERIVAHDRAVVVAALASIVVIAWWNLVSLSSRMPPSGTSGGMVMLHTDPWSPMQPMQPVALFAMWSVMMIAMMLPSAAPMILLFAGVMRRRHVVASPAVPTVVFVAGYLVVWTTFSALAAAAQLALHDAALLSPAMASTSRVLGGGLLVVAGIYEWTPVKSACLGHCRSPLAFFGGEWREGLRGALVMGLRHGAFCLGCCWALMALLFVAGVMNLLWVAALAGVVLLEKVMPRGVLVARVSGVLFATSGVALLVTGR